MSFKTRTKLSDLLKPLREPSQTSMVSLSVVMCIFATLGLLSYFAPILDEMEENRMPLLTANRDESQGGKEFISNRMKDAPLIYGLGHILPAIIWSVLIPTQQMSKIRKNYIQFHRIAGWLVVISAVSLSISGSLFPLLNLSYSDPNTFHIHYLLIPTQVLPFFSRPIYLPFPTFNLVIKFVPLIQLFPLFKAIQAVRVEKNISKHKYWMTLHTIGGYLISLQRVGMIVSMSVGWILASLPKDVHSQIASAFHIPGEDEPLRMMEIERSAFALTAWVAAIWTALWFWKLVGKKEVIDVSQGNGKVAVKDTSL